MMGPQAGVAASSVEESGALRLPPFPLVALDDIPCMTAPPAVKDAYLSQKWLEFTKNARAIAHQRLEEALLSAEKAAANAADALARQYRAAAAAAPTTTAAVSTASSPPPVFAVSPAGPVLLVDAVLSASASSADVTPGSSPLPAGTPSRGMATAGGASSGSSGGGGDDTDPWVPFSAWLGKAVTRLSTELAAWLQRSWAVIKAFVVSVWEGVVHSAASVGRVVHDVAASLLSLLASVLSSTASAAGAGASAAGCAASTVACASLSAVGSVVGSVVALASARSAVSVVGGGAGSCYVTAARVNLAAGCL